MRGPAAVTTAVAVALSMAGCGTVGSRPTGVWTAPSPTPPSISTEEFCGDHGGDTLEPLMDDLAAAFQRFEAGLPGLERSDLAEIEALVDDLDESLEPLVVALRDMAARLEDPDIAADVAGAADAVDTFPEAMRDILLSGEVPDHNPGVTVEEAFEAMVRHCEPAAG